MEEINAVTERGRRGRLCPGELIHAVDWQLESVETNSGCEFMWPHALESCSVILLVTAHGGAFKDQRKAGSWLVEHIFTMSGWLAQ